MGLRGIDCVRLRYRDHATAFILGGPGVRNDLPSGSRQRFVDRISANARHSPRHEVRHGAQAVSRALATAAVASILAGAGCTRAAPAIADAPHIPERQAAGFPTAWRYDPGRRAIRADTAMVTSDEIHATRAGVEILRRGGNAVDAAVAVGFAQAVSYQ